MGNNLTNSPNGLSSFGIPVIPQGIPFGRDSKTWMVDPRYGLDGNDGSIERPFKTLVKALASARADKNDVVFLIATSNSASVTTSTQTATLDWNKNLVHLVGICAPTIVSQRARIGNAAASALSPVMTVSANGCVISNVQIINEIADATALLAVEVTGERNYFKNVHFAGITNATQSAAGAASLKITAGAENVFEGCTIGLDTSSYDADATGILCDAVATRNLFVDCLIQGYITAAGYAHVTIADAQGIDRWLWFKRCIFVAESTNKAVTQTEVFTIPAISQGKIILQDSYCFSDGGAVDWDSNDRGIIWNNSVAAAASAAGGILTNQ
jgi:hypothetical protein